MRLTPLERNNSSLFSELSSIQDTALEFVMILRYTEVIIFFFFLTEVGLIGYKTR